MMAGTINFYNSSSNYVQSATGLGVRQQLQKRDLFDFIGSSIVWRGIGRVLLVLLPLVLLVNILVFSAFSSLSQDVVAMEDRLHSATLKKHELQLKAAALWELESIEKLAAKKLSLRAADKTQQRWFNRRTGTFVYL